MMNITVSKSLYKSEQNLSVRKEVYLYEITGKELKEETFILKGFIAKKPQKMEPAIKKGTRFTNETFRLKLRCDGFVIKPMK